MIDYENMSKLLQFLDVKDFPKTHWFNSIGWEMVSYMHELVVKKTRDLVQVAKFISDALPSPRVNPLEGSPKCNCGKRDSEGAPGFQL